MKVWWLMILSFAVCNPVIANEALPPFDGLVEPKELVDFSSHVPGVLEEVKVERGAWVKKGQVLARLKSGVNKAMVGVALARVEFAKRKLVRNEQLYKKKLISIHAKDELETEIQLAELELVEAKERLDLRTIRSTINGVVVERLGAPGEYVGEEHFITVAQINPLIVELVVPDEYLGAIKVGEIANVEIHKPVEVSSSAKVIVVDKVIDAATSTFGIRLELPNPKFKLPAGVKCKVVF
ncbi:MAG: efflux RND transporter periplasmic adaptor subunit [Desulfobulbaceae bacterium]|nr:efflux RND transporter periplasmic adaptor subunit [Desulfobulbaceae bacterium]